MNLRAVTAAFILVCLCSAATFAEDKPICPSSTNPESQLKEARTANLLEKIQNRIAELWKAPDSVKEGASITYEFQLQQNGTISNATPVEQTQGSENLEAIALGILVRIDGEFVPDQTVSTPIPIKFVFSKAIPQGHNCITLFKMKPDEVQGHKPDAIANPAASTNNIYGKPNLESKPNPNVARADVNFGPYMVDLQRRIKRAWFPPRGQESRKVVVRFKIHSQGEMTDLIVERSSGVAIADQAALAGVQNAAPFRPLPIGAPPVVDIQFTYDYNVFQGGASPAQTAKVEQWKQTLAHHPTADNIFGYALALEAAGRKSEAIEQFNKLLDLNSDGGLRFDSAYQSMHTQAQSHLDRLLKQTGGFQSGPVLKIEAKAGSN